MNISKRDRLVKAEEVRGDHAHFKLVDEVGAEIYVSVMEWESEEQIQKGVERLLTYWLPGAKDTDEIVLEIVRVEGNLLRAGIVVTRQGLGETLLAVIEPKLTAEEIRGKRLTIEQMRDMDLTHLSNDEWKTVIQGCLNVNGSPMERVRDNHRPTYTHTYVTLGVSEGSYEEIEAKLRRAKYDHAFMPNGDIDMHGIAVNRDM